MAYSIKSLGFGKVAVVHNDKHIKTFNGVGAPQDARNFINNQYKSSQSGATTGKISTHEAAADIYLNMQLDEQINEVLSKDAEAGDWIKDFMESDNPKFAGKSKADRKKMALAAYYAKQRNESVGELDKPQKTIEVTRKNGNKFTGTIKSTGDDYHIVKDKSGKQYTVDHSGNTIHEAAELGNDVVSEGSMPYPHGKPEAGDTITWHHSTDHPEIKGTVEGWKDGHLVVHSIDPHPLNTGKGVSRYRVPKNNIRSVQKKDVAEAAELGNESEFKVTKPGSRWKKAPKQDATGKPEKSLEYADKETNVKEDISEATVKTSNGVTTVKHGKDFSVVLHPEHQSAINKLKDEQEHKFKDETGQHWIARRKGEDVHFQSADLNGSMKTHVPASSLSEDHTPVAPVPGQRDKDTAVMVHPETKKRVVISRKNIGNYSDWKEVSPGHKLKENLSFSNMNFDGEVISEEIVIDLTESKYEDYFKAMMKKAGISAISDLKSDEEKKEFMDAVDAGYKAKNESVLAEEYLRTDIEKKIEAHEKMGHKVADVKHTIRGGKPYSEFVITTPEGNKKKYVFHGDVQRHEKLA